MVPALVLVHAAIGLAAVLSSGSDRRPRGRFAQGLAVCGGIAGLLLFFAPPLLPESWRTLEITSPGCRIAGVSIAAAWIVVAVSERSRGDGRWDVVASTGVASTALCMYALNGWTIPALLFAGIASLATAMCLERHGVTSALIAIAIASIGGALIWETIHAESWQLPLPLSGPRLWPAVAGGLALALAAIFSDSPARPMPSTPLALGLAFVTFGSVARAAGPVVALTVLAVALLAVIRTLTRETVAHRVVLVWVVGLSVGLTALSTSPYVVTRSAVAGILATTAIRLWPLSLGRAQIERGILVAFVAMTAGFNAIAAAASYSFARSTAIEKVLDVAPWAAVSALLPVALAGGVVLGASVARNPEPEEFMRSGVLGSWSLVVLTVVVGVFPYVGAGQDAGLAGPVLYVVALAAGVVAARYALLGEVTAPPVSDSRFVDIPLKMAWPRAAVVATLVLAGITGAAIVAATFQGLRVGFL